MPIKPKNNGCTNVSSGHRRHEYTSGYAFPSVFPFLREMINNNRNET